MGHTGTWFLERTEYKHWLAGTNRTLFCPGIPGTGKSVLASLVIGQLQVSFPQDEVAIVWCYCNYKERASQNTTALLCEILRQLIGRQLHFEGEILDLYKCHSKANTTLTLSECFQILRSEVQRYQKIFVVLDALDECDDEDETRTLLPKHIQSLHDNVHLLNTCRPIASIEHEFSKSLQISIGASNEDVEEYVRSRLQSEANLLKHLESDADLQQLLEATIVERCQGM